jgi:shikimate kinase/RimJ/RimL family protein N-acetyltransferase
MSRRIVIVGFMGCGKSTFAADLARRLGGSMIDLDAVITEVEGRSPGEIIPQDGEVAFREIETAALQRVLEETDAQVIALGGGAWTIDLNRALIDQHECLTVWLDAPFDCCWERITAHSDTVRPLASDRESARALYESRRASYCLAHLRIDANQNDIVDQIQSALARCECPFDLQPVLRGSLIELRPLRPDDFAELFTAASDPLIWEQHPAHERYKETVFREYFTEGLESGGALIAIDLRSGKVIGSSRFHGYDPVNSEIEIGWTFLARSYWGGAYNREMKQLMLRHAFRFVDKVVFLIDPENLRSQKAVEKIGAIRSPSRIDHHGQKRLVYQILAPSPPPAPVKTH